MNIMPSLLAAPSLNLYHEIESLIQEGFLTLHIDMMDYHYTNNFGLSPQICQDILKTFPKVTLDVHLMTNPTPLDLISRLQDMGITDISVHPNTLSMPSHLRAALRIEEAHNFSSYQKLLFLCVNPGFANQPMDTSVLEHAKVAKQKGHNITLDGGINLKTLDQVLAINPDNIVIGGGLFGKDREALLVRLKDLLSSTPQS